MNTRITQIATSHQKQMSAMHPHAIIGTIEDAIVEALKDRELVKEFSSNHFVIKSLPENATTCIKCGEFEPHCKCLDGYKKGNVL